ncbi:Hypothetical protein PBC10988_33530 [Planctomycetales bacterium 10988]|nr:Hypothetical protein PBC10988_33530 [Planctomycetales bacterium 10988]
MIRWSYFLPRMLFLAGVLGLIWLLLNPVVHFSLTTIGQSIIGAKVEIESTEVQVWPPGLSLKKLAVANPRQPDHNFVDCDELHFTMESGAFLRKQFVISDGSVKNVRWDQPRESSGKLSEEDESGFGLDDLGINLDGISSLTDSLSGKGMQGLDDLENELKKQLDPEQLEMVRLAGQMEKHWQAVFLQFEGRVHAIRHRAEMIKQTVENAPDDPLQKARAYQQAMQEAQALRAELEQLPGELQQTVAAARRDLNLLNEAKSRDLANLEKKLKKPDFSFESLNEQLLGKELSAELKETLAWIQWARYWVLAKPDEYDPDRFVGETIIFHPAELAPDLWVRKLDLNGEAELNGKTFPFQGTLSEWSTHPKRTMLPTTLDLTLQGNRPIAVNLRCDRTQEEKRDTLHLAYSDLPMKARSWGDPDQIALQLGPSLASVKADLLLIEKNIEGTIHWQQTGLSIQPSFSGFLASSQISSSLTETFASVDELTAVVTIRGTLEQPKWSIDSPLAEMVEGKLKEAIAIQFQQKREELRAQVEQKSGELRARLESYLQAGPQQIAKQWESGQLELTQLRQAAEQRLAARLNSPAVNRIREQIEEPLQQMQQREEFQTIRERLPVQLPGFLR